MQEICSTLALFNCYQILLSDLPKCDSNEFIIFLFYNIHAATEIRWIILKNGLIEKKSVSTCACVWIRKKRVVSKCLGNVNIQLVFLTTQTHKAQNRANEENAFDPLVGFHFCVRLLLIGNYFVKIEFCYICWQSNWQNYCWPYW